MFHDRFRTTPLIADVSDVRSRLPVRSADDWLVRDIELHLPSLRVQW